MTGLLRTLRLIAKRIFLGLIGAGGRIPLSYSASPVLLLISFLVLSLLHETDRFGIRIADIFTNMVSEATPLALLAIGAGLVLASGGVDLSSAGVATAAGIAFASLVQVGVSPVIAAIAALLFGLGSGLLLGWIVCRDMPPLIASWSIGSLWFILSLVYAKLAGSSGILTSTVSGVRFVVPIPISPFRDLTMVAAVLVALEISNLTRHSQAVGANRESAIYAGIRTARVLKQCYTVAGVLSALAGVFWAVLNSGGGTTDFIGRELTGIAVAVIGGTLMSGGYLRLFSIICAAALWTNIQLGTQGVIFTSKAPYDQYIANAGFALLILGLAFFTSRLNIHLTLVQRPKTVNE